MLLEEKALRARGRTFLKSAKHWVHCLVPQGRKEFMNAFTLAGFRIATNKIHEKSQNLVQEKYTHQQTQLCMWSSEINSGFSAHQRGKGNPGRSVGRQVGRANSAF